LVNVWIAENASTVRIGVEKLLYLKMLYLYYLRPENILFAHSGKQSSKRHSYLSAQ
jgi:hypothetical protein